MVFLFSFPALDTLPSCSFDDLIRPRQHVGRNRQADLLSRFKVDNELELYRLLYRKFGRLRASRILSTYIAARRNKSLWLAP